MMVVKGLDTEHDPKSLFWRVYGGCKGIGPGAWTSLDLVYG